MHKNDLKKAIAFALVLVMFCSVLTPLHPYAAPAEDGGQETDHKQETTDAKEAEDAEEDAGEQETDLPVEMENIDIDTAEEFMEFAQNCSVDAWSVNKRVTLRADIDLSGQDSPMIPVFAGIFDGAGHTISGFWYDGSGYIVGLFRYIQREGLVENVTLEGNITGTDEKECIGSLCGVNYGTIRNCSFQGNVSGRDTIGGIVGVNESTGTIKRCTVSGRVTGSYATGGLAGKNHGVIDSCTNHAGVNDDTKWVEEEDERSTGLLQGMVQSEDEVELYSGVDTGGLVGYSDGLVTKCTNYGIIGYEHTGYNIGGIAGRQAGVVSLCINHGTVYGRKDVGGIVGQMEPFIEVDEAESLRNAVNKLHDLINKTIDDMQAAKDVLRADLDSLTAYGDAALASGDSLAGQMTDFVDNNLEQTQAVVRRMEHISDQLPGIMDHVSEATDAFGALHDSLSGLPEHLDVTGSMEDGAYDETAYARVALLSTVGGKLRGDRLSPQAGETVTITAVPETGYALADTPRAMDANGAALGLTSAGENRYTFTMPERNVKVSAEFTYVGTGSDEPEDWMPSVSGNDIQKPETIILSSNLSGDARYRTDGNGVVTLTVVPDTSYILSEAPGVTDGNGQAVLLSKRQGGTYEYEFQTVQGSGPYRVDISFRKQSQAATVDTASDDMRKAVENLQAASDRVNSSMESIRALAVDPDGTVKNWGELNQEEQDELTAQMVNLAEAVEDMSGAAAVLPGSLGVIARVLSPNVNDAVEAARRDLDAASAQVQKLQDALRASADGIRGIVDYVNAQPDIQFSKLGEGFDAAREDLHTQLCGISDSLKSLTGNASDHTDIINEDLRAVNDQLNVVFNLLADHMTDYSELSIEELYEEISDEEMDTVTTGKTDSCTNRGIVKGDINIGGIAGSMSIDDEDPEDNAAGSVTYRIGDRFITKCIITNSVNEGYVTAKKNGAGGVVGYMKHGIVADCEGYGSVESTEGDYVGGICGESLTIIRRCYALCTVTGGKNVGGIAGYGDTLKDCCAIVNCEAALGRMGAIAGQVASYENTFEDGEEEAKVCRNFYVGDGMYGVDNISYVGVAEPVTYEELLMVEHLPIKFWHLKVTYRIEDEELGQEEVKFGESLAGLHYPSIPEKEGYYGVWPDYTDRVMTGSLVIQGEYKEDVTVVESDEKTAADTQERPYALVEQTFTEDTVLNVRLSDIAPPAQTEGKECVVYDVLLENGGIQEGDTFAVRLYNPYENAVVWGYRNGSWSELDSKERGRYLQVEMTGPAETFCVAEHRSDRVLLLVAGVCIAAALAGVIVVIRKVISRRRMKKTARKAEEQKVGK